VTVEGLTTMATRRPFRALQQAGFRRYYLGQVVSSSGTFMQSTALGWLVLQETGSAAKLGLVIAAGSLPTLLIGPWGGPLADRANRRVLLLCTQTTFGLLATALWVAAAAHEASLAVVITISVAGGIVQVADSPARQAFVADLVPPEDLASAVSLNGVVVNSSRVVGPAVAGILIATVGTTPCFAVNAISYVAVVVALLTIHPRPVARVTSQDGVRAGLRYAASRQQLWLPLAMMSLIGLVAFNFAVVLPVLAERVFHGSGGTYGLLSTMLGIGAITGSLSVGLFRHPRRVYLAAAACAFGAGLAGVALAPNVISAAVLLALTGAAAFCFVTMTSTTLQLHSASEYRGRIMALFGFVYLGTTPIGSLIAGWITGAAGARATLLAGAGACLLAGIGGFAFRSGPNPDAALTDLALATCAENGPR
jgi:MFS family permease